LIDLKIWQFENEVWNGYWLSVTGYWDGGYSMIRIFFK